MNGEDKKVTLFDGGKVRMTVSRWEVLVEELPRKPCKVQLRRFSLNTYHGTSVYHDDSFIVDNILARVPSLRQELSFEALEELLTAALDEVKASTTNDAARKYGSTVSRDEVHYLKVVPTDAKPLIVELQDTVLHVKWTSFSSYSPSSDFQQSDPHYMQKAEKSPAAARKLFQLVSDPKKGPAVLAELATVGWSNLGAWLTAHGVHHETHHSQWT